MKLSHVSFALKPGQLQKSRINRVGGKRRFVYRGPMKNLGYYRVMTFGIAGRQYTEHREFESYTKKVKGYLL